MAATVVIMVMVMVVVIAAPSTPDNADAVADATTVTGTSVGSACHTPSDVMLAQLDQRSQAGHGRKASHSTLSRTA